MKSGTAILQVSDLSAGYGPHTIIRDVSFSVSSGQVLGIIGANGSGKSTCVKAVMGLCRVRSGRVTLTQGEGELMRERDFAGMKTYVIARSGLAYLPQLNFVFDELTVKENLEMGAYTASSKELPKRMAEVIAVFPEVGLSLSKKATALSGGQRGMVGLARALMSKPRFMILDEPTAGLAPMYKSTVWRHISRVADSGVGVVVVEQDARRAIEHSDRCCVFAEGAIIHELDSKSVGNAEEVAGFYLGVPDS